MINRRLLAGLASVGGAITVPFLANNGLFALYLPCALLLCAALAIHARALGAQLLCRATWWGGLVLGVLVSLAGALDEQPAARILASLCGLALLAASDLGLAREDTGGAFDPRAYRGTILIALVLALADIQTLSLFGAIAAEIEIGAPWRPIACAAVMIVGLVGLVRLKTWGLVVNVAANVMIAALAVSGALELAEPVVVALTSTAVAQLVLPLPMIAGLVRGARPTAAHPRAARVATTMIVVAGVVVSASSALL